MRFTIRKIRSKAETHYIRPESTEKYKKNKMRWNILIPFLFSYNARMPKKLFIKKIHNLFSQVEIHPWYQTLWTFPIFVRMSIGFSFFLYGLIALFSPLPGGVIFLILGGFLLFWKNKTRAFFLRTIYFLRLHILFSKILLWWKKYRK